MNAEDASVVDQFVLGCERGDVDLVRSCLAKDAVVWHNFDNAEMDVNSFLEGFPAAIARMTRREIVGPKREYFEGGLVQQHTLRATLADGREFNIPSCMVFRFSGGLIARIDEYIDIAPMS